MASSKAVQSIAAAGIRSITGSTVIGLEEKGQKEPTILPPPEATLSRGMTLIMIGSPEQEARCRELLSSAGKKREPA